MTQNIEVQDSGGNYYVIPEDKVLYFRWMDEKYDQHNKRGFRAEHAFLKIWDASFEKYEIRD